jgi:predicted dehydrogenase
MKVGIVGCGLNSDYHINFARAYKGALIVGVVDKDAEKAAECAKRFGISGVYSSISELVENASPDVIHVLTPPRTHYEVARQVIEAGCHALVEKPMTLNAEEARLLYELAEAKGVKLCTVHNHLFDPCMSRVDGLVKEGHAGKVINVESYYGLNTKIPAFRDYPVPNRLPWLYDLPGSVYHDFMPHPLYVLLEYTGSPKSIDVVHSTNGVLPQGMPDEIRVQVDGERCLGTLTFSFAAKPHLHFIRVYGTEMMAEVDINTMTSVSSR